jgi:hypothetical protein
VVFWLTNELQLCTITFKNIQMKKLKNIIAFLAITAVTISCSKPENGKDGAPGTANVIYSDWVSVTATNDGTTWTGGITAPKITQEILNKGTILVFNQFQGSTVYPLPILYTDTILNYVTYVCSLSQITISSNFDAFTPGDKYRYIIIPGGTSVNGKMTPTDYKKMSYTQVCSTLNIPY